MALTAIHWYRESMRCWQREPETEKGQVIVWKEERRSPEMGTLSSFQEENPTKGLYQYQFLKSLLVNNHFIVLLKVGFCGSLLTNLLAIFCQNVAYTAEDQSVRICTGKNQIVLGRVRFFVQGVHPLVNLSYHLCGSSDLIQTGKAVDPCLDWRGGIVLG